MKLLLAIFGLLISFLTYGQVNNDVKVIAKLISPGKGSKIHISEYEVIKTIKGKVSNDTIRVGYYFYNENKNAPDTALLTLKTYTGNTKVKDYYIFPDYNPQKGIEKVKISTIEFDYWEMCEKGKCNPLTFTRKSKNENWYLIMPCGGTATTITLSKQKGIPKGNSVIQKTEVPHSECPPIFDLTNLTDGKYYAYMLGCGLGGQIELNLKTESD